MPADYYNPFQTSDLLLPKKFRKSIDSLISRGNDISPREAPFKKYVDFWFFSACLAIHEEMKVEAVSEELRDTWRFERGTVLLSDKNRIGLMEIVGKGVLKNSQASPQEIARLFNDYAALGTEIIITKIEKDKENTDSLWLLLGHVKESI